jgi:hypothetical protein
LARDGGPTLNYSGSNPRFGDQRQRYDASALPQFHVSTDSLEPDDAAATLERAPVRVRRSPSRPWMKSVPTLASPQSPAALHEERDVHVELDDDDLLLVEAEAPRPLPWASSLDRASERAFVAREPLDIEQFGVPSYRFGPPRLEATPSVAPLSLAPVAMSSPVPFVQPEAPRSSGTFAAIATVFLAVLVGLTVGAVALGPTHVVAAGRRVAHAVRPPVKEVAPPVIAVTPPAVPPKAVEAPPSLPVAALPVAPTPVASLPPPSIDPTMTILTFRKAKDLRVFVDGRQVGRAVEPIKTKCGKHKVKIGARNRPRAMDLPCGEELALD